MTSLAQAATTRVESNRPLLGFCTLILLSSLLLQRIGLPAGAKSINIVGPIGMAAAGYALATGLLAFNRWRLACFLALSLWILIGQVHLSTSISRFAADASPQSLAQFLILTSFATIAFGRPIAEERFFNLVSKCLALIAIAGLLQFVAQFAGLQLFSFRGLVPNALLFEDGYNLIIPFGIGSLIKSNGFFLLEPSIFSQFMALGIAVETLTSRRPRLLALFVAGLVVSGSGTGWLVLIAFVLSVAFGMGLRGIGIAAAVIVGFGIVGLILSVAAPDVIGAFSDRLGEISTQSTSGHLRFITPYWVAGDVLARDPMVALFGLGAGVSERLTLPYEYDVNTPVKIVLEYGFPALIAYLGVLSMGAKTSVQRTLVFPSLVLLLLTGGYQQFPPVLFPILLIISIAKLEPSPQGVRQP
jgi:hypothetical protein